MHHNACLYLCLCDRGGNKGRCGCVCSFSTFTWESDNIFLIITLFFMQDLLILRIFCSVFHKCSVVNPCRHGGVCEAVDWTYQCNCAGTAHHGPVCEKGTRYTVTVIACFYFVLPLSQNDNIALKLVTSGQHQMAG